MREANNFLFTQVVERVAAPSAPSQQKAATDFSTVQKLKDMKRKSKEMQLEYLLEMRKHHRIQKSLQTINRQSLIKRIEFLKVYGNKKAKYQTKTLLQKNRQQEEQLQRQSLDAVKRRKLQYELQHILQQDQEEEHINRLQEANRKNKMVEITQKQMESTLQRQFQSKRHDEIKRRNNDFLIRKKAIQTSLTMRNRHNYAAKIQQELAIIDQYESVINNMEQLATLQTIYLTNNDEMSNSITYRTLEPHSESFKTTAQTSLHF